MPKWSLYAATLARSICDPLLAGTDVVFNLAAQTSHMRGQHDPLSDLTINALAQLQLIQAVRDKASEALIVHASTRQLYGRPQLLPVAEDHPLAPPDATSISSLPVNSIGCSSIARGEHAWFP